MPIQLDRVRRSAQRIAGSTAGKMLPFVRGLCGGSVWRASIRMPKLRGFPSVFIALLTIKVTESSVDERVSITYKYLIDTFRLWVRESSYRLPNPFLQPLTLHVGPVLSFF